MCSVVLSRIHSNFKWHSFGEEGQVKESEKLAYLPDNNDVQLKHP